MSIDPPRSPGGTRFETYGDIRLWPGSPALMRHDSGMMATAGGDAIRIGGGGLRAPALRRLLLPSLSHTFAHHGVYVLHAAGVVIGGSVVLVLGATGSGKSTVAGAALRAGYGVISDDMVAIGGEPARALATGIPRPPAIPVEAAPDTAAPFRSADHRGRVLVGPEELDTGTHPIGALIFPRHGGEDGGLGPEPVSGPDVLTAVIGSFPAAWHPPHVTSFLPVAAGVARCPAWTLDLHPTPAVRVEQIAAALSAVGRP